MSNQGNLTFTDTLPPEEQVCRWEAFGMEQSPHIHYDLLSYSDTLDVIGISEEEHVDSLAFYRGEFVSMKEKVLLNREFETKKIVMHKLYNILPCFEKNTSEEITLQYWDKLRLIVDEYRLIFPWALFTAISKLKYMISDTCKYHFERFIQDQLDEYHFIPPNCEIHKDVDDSVLELKGSINLKVFVLRDIDEYFLERLKQLKAVYNTACNVKPIERRSFTDESERRDSTTLKRKYCNRIKRITFQEQNDNVNRDKSNCNTNLNNSENYKNSNKNNHVNKISLDVTTNWTSSSQNNRVLVPEEVYVKGRYIYKSYGKRKDFCWDDKDTDHENWNRVLKIRETVSKSIIDFKKYNALSYDRILQIIGQSQKYHEENLVSLRDIYNTFGINKYTFSSCSDYMKFDRLGLMNLFYELIPCFFKNQTAKEIGHSWIILMKTVEAFGIQFPWLQFLSIMELKYKICIIKPELFYEEINQRYEDIKKSYFMTFIENMDNEYRFYYSNDGFFKAIILCHLDNYLMALRSRFELFAQSIALDSTTEVPKLTQDIASDTDETCSNKNKPQSTALLNKDRKVKDITNYYNNRDNIASEEQNNSIKPKYTSSNLNSNDDCYGAEKIVIPKLRSQPTINKKTQGQVKRTEPSLLALEQLSSNSEEIVTTNGMLYSDSEIENCHKNKLISSWEEYGAKNDTFSKLNYIGDYNSILDDIDEDLECYETIINSCRNANQTSFQDSSPDEELNDYQQEHRLLVTNRLFEILPKFERVSNNKDAKKLSLQLYQLIVLYNLAFPWALFMSVIKLKSKLLYLFPQLFEAIMNKLKYNQTGSKPKGSVSSIINIKALDPFQLNVVFKRHVLSDLDAYFMSRLKAMSSSYLRLLEWCSTNNVIITNWKETEDIVIPTNSKPSSFRFYTDDKKRMDSTDIPQKILVEESDIEEKELSMTDEQNYDDDDDYCKSSMKSFMTKLFNFKKPRIVKDSVTVV